MRQNLVKVCTKESLNLISNLIPPTSVQYTFQLNKIFYILSCSTRACTFDIIFFSISNIHISKQPPPGGRKTEKDIELSSLLMTNVKVKHAMKKNLCHITSEQFQISNLSTFVQTNPDEYKKLLSQPSKSIYALSLVGYTCGRLPREKLAEVFPKKKSRREKLEGHFPKK